MEKRRHPRVDCTFQVSCQTFENNKTAFNNINSKNISISGVLLQAANEGKVGADIVVKFMIPTSGDKILAKGKVVRVRKMNGDKFEIGVQFINIREKDLDMVKKYIENKAKA
ncbi:MAG: PilZ domain-containing protein [bacterium]|nr:PilZ domain-containing protein [bacterium]